MQPNKEWWEMTRTERVGLLVEEERGGARWFRCVFTDNDETLGHAFIYGFGALSCGIAATCRRIHPGGRITVEPMSEAKLPPERYRHRLLSEVEAAQAMARGLVQ